MSISICYTSQHDSPCCLLTNTFYEKRGESGPRQDGHSSIWLRRQQIPTDSNCRGSFFIFLGLVGDGDHFNSHGIVKLIDKDL